MEYECQCCNQKCGTIANLNKHLSICPKYHEWIKNYKPPQSIRCEKCKRNFIDISNHICDINFI